MNATPSEIQAMPAPGLVPGKVQVPPPAQGAVAGRVDGQALREALSLRDIHPPVDPEPWPPAPGWWVVLALLAATLAVAGARAWRSWRARGRRRRILAELAGIGSQAQGAELVAAVSALLKRVALARFDRPEVAPLTGQAWLDFLDRHGGAGRFASGPGRVLAEGPYAPAPDLDPPALLELAGDWVGRNI